MTYKVYIRKDYKPVTGKSGVPLMGKNRVFVAILFAVLGLFVVFITDEEPGMTTSGTDIQEYAYSNHPDTLLSEPENNAETITPEMQSLSVPDSEEYQSNLEETDVIPEQEPVLSEAMDVDDVIPDKWESLRIESGDNLSLIFDKMNISPRVLHEIMSLGKDVSILKKLIS